MGLRPKRGLHERSGSSIGSEYLARSVYESSKGIAKRSWRGVPRRAASMALSLLLVFSLLLTPYPEALAQAGAAAAASESAQLAADESQAQALSDPAASEGDGGDSSASLMSVSGSGDSGADGGQDDATAVSGGSGSGDTQDGDTEEADESEPDGEASGAGNSSDGEGAPDAGSPSDAGNEGVPSDVSGAEGDPEPSDSSLLPASDDADQLEATNPQVTAPIIEKVELLFLPVLDPSDEGYVSDPVIYDPDSLEESVSKPTIGRSKGAMQLSALVYWSDGTTSAVDPKAQDSLQATWTIENSYDESGTEINSIIASVDSAGEVKALGAGNGSIKVKMSLDDYPEFTGADMLIFVTGNADSGTAISVRSAALYHRIGSSGSYQHSASADSIAISNKQDSCSFRVKLIFNDFSSAWADEVGLPVNWSITQKDASGSVIGAGDTPIVSLSSKGVVSALDSGNGTVQVSASVAGISLTTTLSVLGNDGSGLKVQTISSIDYSDRTHTQSTYSETRGQYPTIDREQGSATLTPMLRWRGGIISSAYDSIYKVTWEAVAFYDESGAVTTEKLATISNDGVVTATGKGNGSVLVRCTVGVLQKDCIVKIYGNALYVKKVEIVDAMYEPYGNALDMSESAGWIYGNIVRLYARVTYSDGTVRNTLFGDTIEGLTWASYRGTTTETELYSTIDQWGTFTALSGFAEATVVAKVEGGSAYGSAGTDPQDTLRIFRDSEDDREGVTRELTVKIIHQSEFETYGYDATPAEEITVTASQLSSLGAYSDWYTMRTGGSWGTMYAYGVSIPDFLSLLGFETSDLVYMQFSGIDAYTADTRYSADAILSSCNRYSNYYMHPVSSSANYLGRQSVMPMLAISAYIDWGNDYNGSGFSKMTSSNCIRFIMGMQGVETNNARRSIKCVSEVKVVVVDPPEEVVEPGSGGGELGDGGVGNSSGSGTGDGGGTGVLEGTAVEGEGGGESMGGEGDGDGSGIETGHKGEDSTAIYLREIVSSELPVALAKVEHFNPLGIAMAVAALLALIAGGLRTNRRFKWDIELGERMSTV